MWKIYMKTYACSHRNNHCRNLNSSQYKFNVIQTKSHLTKEICLRKVNELNIKSVSLEAAVAYEANLPPVVPASHLSASSSPSYSTSGPYPC